MEPTTNITIFCCLVLIIILVNNNSNHDSNHDSNPHLKNKGGCSVNPEGNPEGNNGSLVDKNMIVENPINYLERNNYNNIPLENIIKNNEISRDVQPLLVPYETGDFYNKKNRKGVLRDVDEFLHEELIIK